MSGCASEKPTTPYTTQMLNGILNLVMLFQMIAKGIASRKRLREILDCQPELMDGSFEGSTAVQGSIEFQNVSFGFPGAGRTVLRRIDLSIRPGETVAVMGSSSCDKSALVYLLAVGAAELRHNAADGGSHQVSVPEGAEVLPLPPAAPGGS